MNYKEFIGSLNSSQRNILSRLTSASSEPAPGYLYDELIDCIKSNIIILSDIEDYLINKLNRNEPYIKFKCLKLLKILCNKLPQEFIRNKVLQSQTLLQCRGYKAPFNEYSGDYLTKLIRNEVEDLLAIVCSDQKSDTSMDTIKNRIFGFGNEGRSSGGFSNAGGTVQGFGNSGNVQGFGNTSTSNNFSSLQGFGNSGNVQGFGNTSTSNNFSSLQGFGNSGNVQGFGNTSTSNNFSSLQGFGNTPVMEGFGNYSAKTDNNVGMGYNVLRVLGDVANKYIPSDIVEKIERVSSVITTTAMEQIEKHMGYNNTFNYNKNII